MGNSAMHCFHELKKLVTSFLLPNVVFFSQILTVLYVRGVRGGSFVVWVFFPMASAYILVLIQATYYLKLTFLLWHLLLWCVSREPPRPSLFCFSFTRHQNLGFLCCCPTVWCRTDTYTKILADRELCCSRTQSSSSVPQLTSLAESIWPC